MNGNEAHMLDERLRFGSASSLTLVSGVISPADEVIQRANGSEQTVYGNINLLLIGLYNFIFVPTWPDSSMK